MAAFRRVHTPAFAAVILEMMAAALEVPAWNAQTGELIAVLRGHDGGFEPFCPPLFTPDGSRLVSGSTDGTVRIWDMNLVERNGILRGHKSYVYDVAFNPNGRNLAGQVARLRKKFACGAHFAMTQPVYDPLRFDQMGPALPGNVARGAGHFKFHCYK